MSLTKKIVVMIIALVMLVYSCTSEDSSAKPADGSKAKPAKLVKVTPAVKRKLIERLELPGTIQPENIANILSTSEGKIADMLVREGDPVAANQVVAKVSSLLREDIVNSARLLLENKRNAARKNPGDQQTLLELKQAEQDYQFALEQYKEFVVTSPISGVVSKRWIDIGDMVPAKAKLFEVQSSNRLRVDVPVSELDIRKLNLHQKVKILADACPAKLFHGSISRIHPRVESTTRNGLVEIQLLDPCPNLKAGMFVRAIFEVRVIPEAVAIPVESIIDRPKQRTCFVVNNGIAREVVLQTGLVDSGWVEVSGGLKPGDKVVVEGQQQLKTGAPVKVQGSSKKPIQSTGGKQ